jgi:hypothetical protein
METVIRRHPEAVVRDSPLLGTQDGGDVEIAITTRSIRDPAEGVYEYLEDRHEEQGLRQRCYLFPMQLSGWILRREGMLAKSYKRRFCVFDATHDELWVYRDDNTSRSTGKLLRRLVVTRVDMTIENGIGDMCITGYDREKELFKSDSQRVASRRGASTSSGAFHLPGEQQKYYRPQHELLRAVSAKASTVWSHCLRHHMKNHTRRKRILRLAEFEAMGRWDLIEEELLDEDENNDQDQDDEQDAIEPEFVFQEVRKDPLDARRGKRLPAPPQLVFDGEGDLRITKSCDFSSLAGVRAAEARRTRPTPRSPLDAVDAVLPPRLPVVHQSHPAQLQGGLPRWQPTSSDMLLMSDHSSLASGELMSSIWDDEAILSYRVDFDSVQRTRVLSSGAFGEVWLAQYRGTKTIAVKCLKQTIELKRQQIRDFAREIRLMSKLDHERIVTFLGVAWTMESNMQLLMEYMPYGDLRTYLAHMSTQKRATTKRPRNTSVTDEPERVWTPQQWRIAVDIIEGLVYLHSLDTPLVHCDLKSRNLLLDPNVRVKIADFGIARFYTHVDTDDDDDHDSEENGGTTSSGSGSSSAAAHRHAVTQRALRGTGRWIAPELLLGGIEFSPLVDVYSFGVVLTEIDTFELPFHAQTRNRDGEEMDESVLLHHIVADGWMPKFSRTCPDEIRAIGQKCMAFLPEDRPSSLDVAYKLRKAMARAVGKAG